MIVCAAIKLPCGLILMLPKPYRHGHIIKHDDENRTSQSPIDYSNQGFMTSEGEFVNRKVARNIADKNGQTSARDMHLDDLYSEDIW